MINFTNAGRPTDIWTDNQVRAYEAFKEELENQGLVTNVASEFMDDEDILEVNENIPDANIEIYNIAEIFGIEVNFYTTYKYDIIRAILEYGLPRIIDNFGRIVTLTCEEGDTPQNIIDAFNELAINLDSINVAGKWGDKMIWTFQGQIFTILWERGDKIDI
jgi:hypothetical protein